MAPTEVEAANEQNRLWTKNFECTGSAVTEFQHVKNQLNIEVGARVCPSGDVLLLIKPPARDPIYRWVAINKFVQTVGLLGVTAAEADVAHPRYAQGVYVVLSQRWLQQGLLKQRLRYPDGQCFDAVVNTYTGALLSQTPVACDAAF